MSFRTPLIAGAGWLAAAVVATLIGVGGIRLIGDSLTTTPGGVLDRQDIARALAVSPSTETRPTGGPTATPTAPPDATPSKPSGTQRGFSSAGGSVIAGCRDNQPYLVSWSASPGYRITKHEAESEHVEVRFEGSGGRSEIRVICSGDTPVER